MHPVLKLDSAGNPRQWISTEVAAHYVAKGQVSWQLGANLQVLRGGYNKQGARSVLEVPSIIAITGPVSAQGIDGTVSVRKDYLLKRDRQTCAYCGERYPREYLQMEHIIPQSRGGKTTWQNTVCACLLSRSKSLPVHDVSEWSPARTTSRSVSRTRNRYQLALRVRKEAR